MLTTQVAAPFSQKRGGKTIPHRIGILGLSLSMLLCFVLIGSATSASAALTSEEQQAVSQIKTFNTAFKAIAREVTPSVVTINVTKKIKTAELPRQNFAPFPFPFFQMPEQHEDQRGTGSGIVITKDGYIITNNHVAGDADKISVTFSDHRQYDAELVGADPRTDIAVIKIKADNLHPARVGDSDNVQIGEWVMAIGAPLNLESTVTTGIISAIGRDINILRDSFGVEDFIQTDAAINPGNSGGALVNLNGEVIGINTAIATRTGTFVGYGFAVPIDLARKVMDDIVKYGEVKRGVLGVSLQPVDAGKASAFGLDRPQGVLIGEVYAGTAAARAGLQAGDIILSLDGQKINRPNQLQSLIARKSPGVKIVLDVRRNEKNLTIKATLGEKIPEDMQRLASNASPNANTGEVGELGLTVSNLTPQIAQSLGIGASTKGVVVTDVSRGPAREAGFTQGDIIYGVRQKGFQEAIASVRDFKDAVSKLHKGDYAAFSVERNGQDLFLATRIPE